LIARLLIEELDEAFVSIFFSVVFIGEEEKRCCGGTPLEWLDFRLGAFFSALRSATVALFVIFRF
jgi:hypothetical protein